jgi:uncharacterized protein YndB with AHSA1/START domain
MTEIDAPQEQDFGVLERGDATIAVRFTRQLPHPPQKVWRALTEAGHLAAWFPTTIEGDMTTVGAPLRFAFSQVPVPPMDGRMHAFDPPKLLEFTWGEDTLRFELTAHEDGTTLEFTATFIELGKVARDGAGWHVCLDRLGYELAGVPAPGEEDQRWRLVHPEYLARFGPEAATIGPPREWEDTYGSADAGPG